jgi:hypothetical protein
MLTHLKANKNIYITLGLIGVASVVSYFAITDVMNFKRDKDDGDE